MKISQIFIFEKGSYLRMRVDPDLPRPRCRLPPR